jgi:integrase
MSRGKVRFDLSPETSVSDWEDAKWAAKLLAGREHKGWSITARDRDKINHLSPYVRGKLIRHGLLEGEKSETVPTLKTALKDLFVYWDTKYREKQPYIRKYLTEYFKDNPRIDQITVIQAAGFRKYLQEERHIKSRRNPDGNPLGEATTNNTIKVIKSAFKDICGILYKDLQIENPFTNVRGGAVCNPARWYQVSVSEIQAAIDCISHRDPKAVLELQSILAFARFAGLRIPSEIRELKFSDFSYQNGGLTFVVRKGKTAKKGQRTVPVFPELRLYYEKLQSAAAPEQEYLFPKYRTGKNVTTTISNCMRRAGLKKWPEFMTNLRRSCINDCRLNGYTVAQLTAMFGNSADVQNKYYIFGESRSDVAERSKRSLFAAAGKVPTQFPTLTGNSTPFWESFNADTPEEEVAVSLLVRHGWSHDRALNHVRKQCRLMPLGKYIKSMQTMRYDWMEGKISGAKYWSNVTLFVGRCLWENVKARYIPIETTDVALGTLIGQVGSH